MKLILSSLAQKKEGKAELALIFRTLRKHLLYVFGFSCWVNLLMLTGPIFMLQVYERVLSSRSEQTLLVLFSLVVALYAIMGSLDYIRGQVMARVGALFQDRLSDRAFNAALAGAVSPEGKRAPAAALRDLDSIQAALAGPGCLAILDLPWLPIYLIIIYLFHPWLGILATAAAILLIIVALLGELTTKKKQQAALQADGGSRIVENTVWRDAEAVLALGMRQNFAKLWRNKKQEAQKARLDHNGLSGKFRTTAKSLRLLLQSAMLALGALLVLKTEITPGVMIAASIIMGRALAPVDQLTGSYSALQNARSALQDLEILFGSMPAEESKPLLPRPNGLITVSKLAVGPPETRDPLVRGLEFSIRPGEALGIIGPSGSGKSSLARTLAGIWKPLYGELRLDGATYDQWDPDVLGRLIGYLPQQNSLFQGSITANIARFDPDARFDDVVKAATLAGAHEIILKLPRGYETEIGQNGSGISGGQALLVSLARAFYGDPVLLVLDEPNAYLDAVGETALLDALQKVKQRGTSIAIVAHNPRAIKHCENTLVIMDGYQNDFMATSEIIGKVTKPVNPPQKSIGQEETTDL